MILDSFAFSDIDLNLCWIRDDLFSTEENSFFNVMPTCPDIPTVLIENNEGRYRLHFKKEKSSVKISGNKFWYNRYDLTSMMKILS